MNIINNKKIERIKLKISILTKIIKFIFSIYTMKSLWNK